MNTHRLHAFSHDAIQIRNARVIDPVVGRDEIADIAIVRGLIAEKPAPDAVVIDGHGLIVAPGLKDIHVHLREPGQGHKETIDSGTAAAAAGGFTYVACMPNTRPPIDHPDIVRWILNRARDFNYCNVGVVASITQGRAGRDVVEMAALLHAGAVGFSDDGDGVEDDKVMTLAFEQAARLNAIIIQHCEFKRLSAGGVMHLGEVSRRLRLPGLDPRSEEAMIERDIDLCRRTGARYHVAHISTARAIELVRAAKRAGLPVTTEVCTHHLVLTDEACKDADPNTKMHPPLRPRSDVDACRQGLLDGTIDCIITDHAPHAAQEKGAGFLKAPAGIIGLETSLGVAAYAMVQSGMVDWYEIVGWMSTGPASVLRLPVPSLVVGCPADVTLIDPTNEWLVEPELGQSLSTNTPFGGWHLTGRSLATIRGSRLLDAGLGNRWISPLQHQT